MKVRWIDFQKELEVSKIVPCLDGALCDSTAVNDHWQLYEGEDGIIYQIHTEFDPEHFDLGLR